MIHVVRRIILKRGMAPLFLREFRDLANLVSKEPGCLDYFPAQDVRMGLENQETSPDAVTILEKWASRQDLEQHLRSGHMRSFRIRVQDIIAEKTLTIVGEI